MSQLCDKDKGILSRMKTLHVYLLCLVVLFIFYMVQVRIVDGYLCFDDPTGIYAAFLIVLSIFILFISLAKTPQVKIPPLNRPKDKLAIDLILIIGLSFICSGWVVSFAGRIHPILMYSCMGGYAIIPIFYIRFTSDNFPHFGYVGSKTFEYILLGMALGLAATCFSKALYGLTGLSQSLQSIPFFGQLSGISFKTLPLLLIGLAGGGTQNLLCQCQQSLVQDISGHTTKGLILFVVISAILLWAVYEPLTFPLTRQTLLRGGNLIGIVLMALLYYKTNSLVPVIITHIFGNFFLWLPSF